MIQIFYCILFCFKILNLESANKFLINQHQKLIEEQDFQIANFQREQENSQHFYGKLMDEKLQEFDIFKKALEKKILDIYL